MADRKPRWFHFMLCSCTLALWLSAFLIHSKANWALRKFRAAVLMALRRSSAETACGCRPLSKSKQRAIRVATSQELQREWADTVPIPKAYVHRRREVPIG